MSIQACWGESCGGCALASFVMKAQATTNCPITEARVTRRMELCLAKMAWSDNQRFS
jgi:hypothetical protein